MKRLLLLALVAVACRPAAAQFPPGRPQAGLNGMWMGSLLPPGRAQMMASYCGDLLGDPPTHNDRYLPDDRAGSITWADGTRMSLRDAVKAGLLAVRGGGPGDPARPRGALWIDLYVVNTAQMPGMLDIPAGALFQPIAATKKMVAHRVPAQPARNLVQTVSEAGAAGSDVACFATWVATGSTRADLQNTLVRVLTAREIGSVNEALKAAGLDEVRDGQEEYDEAYDKALAGLGDTPALRTVRVRLPNGPAADLIVRRGVKTALAEARPDSGEVLRFAAEVTDTDGGRWRVRLLQLKTGRPLAGIPTYLAPPPGV